MSASWGNQLGCMSILHIRNSSGIHFWGRGVQHGAWRAGHFGDPFLCVSSVVRASELLKHRNKRIDGFLPLGFQRILRADVTSVASTLMCNRRARYDKGLMFNVARSVYGKRTATVGLGDEYLFERFEPIGLRPRAMSIRCRGFGQHLA